MEIEHKRSVLNFLQEEHPHGSNMLSPLTSFSANEFKRGCRAELRTHAENRDNNKTTKRKNKRDKNKETKQYFS